MHVVPAVHTTPSSHAVPSARGAVPQLPVAGSQTPTTHVALIAEQSTAAPPPHVPPVQNERIRQRSPSSQSVPSIRGEAVHRPVAGLHEPRLH